MSRSRRKPYITDQQGSSTKWIKRRASRAVRHVPDPSDGAAYKREFNSWDIRDYSFHSPELKKAYRK